MKRIRTVKDLINELIEWKLIDQVRVSFLNDFGRPHQIHEVYKTFQDGRWYVNIILKGRKRRLK